MDRLRKRHPQADFEIVPIRTTGDKMQSVSLSVIGGKGVFVKEIEEALLRGDVDLAVHSMKDMPSEIPAGLEIAVVPLREDPRDVLISRAGRKLEELPPGARIGTGSLRRGFQLKSLMRDVEVVSLRGNLDTRIRKIESENLDGIIVAAAGLRRMGWAGKATQYLPVDLMIPAVGQGALAIEVRAGDGRTKAIAAFLDDAVTRSTVMAERAFLAVLGGGCQVPVAGHATLSGSILYLRALIGSVDGRLVVKEDIRGAVGEHEALGRELGERILARGGRDILDAVEACRQERTR